MSLTLTLARGGGEVSGSGTNIELDGTIAGGAIESVEMYGDTEQAASPNPDYPQEVQTVTGRQVVTISDGGSQSQEYEINLGKNLFNKDNISILNGYFEYSGDTIHSNANNRVFYISCEPNTRYSITQGTSTLSNHLFQVATTSVTPAVGVTVSGFFDAGSNNVGNYLTASDAKYMVVRIRAGDEVSTFWDGVQIEKGPSATTYAPYFTPIELCKIGTYQDYIYKSGDDWYLHKEINKYIIDGTNGNYTRITTNRFNISGWPMSYKMERGANYSISDKYITVQQYVTDGNFNSGTANMKFALGFHPLGGLRIKDSNYDDVDLYKAWVTANPISAYAVLATPTDTQITNAALISQLNALNAGTTYDGTTIITVASENLAGPLEVKASTTITKTYTEVEIGSPFTIADVEGKSSNTTLDGNVYVDWAYNKKQYSFDLFNLTPQDYADIRAYYDYQFNNSAFPTITVPELNIDKLPVYMEISSRNIINQCLLTDKLTIKFRETVQP